jgi:hypothetical protein
MPFENILDQRPADAEQQRNMFDGSDPAQIHDEPFECLDVTLLAYCECNWLSKLQTASLTELLMSVKNNELLPGTYWERSKGPLETPLERQLMGLGATASACALIKTQLDVVINSPTSIVRPQMLVASQAKGVIQKARRRHRGSPLLCFCLQRR